MGEVPISKFIQQLEFLAQETTKEARMIIGVDEEVDSLSTNLKAIEAVLKQAETRRVTEPSVRVWLDKLADFSCDMDDVLDKWVALIGKEVCVGDTTRPDPVHCQSITRRVRELNERLDSIAIEKGMYDFNTEKPDEQFMRQEVSITSFVDTMSRVYGREKEKLSLLGKLFSGTGQVDVIPLVGIGGIGKTALSRLVFDSEEVKAWFEKRIWIRVSEPFNELRIANAILESVEGCAFNMVEMKSLVRRIRESIKGIKFLLVLDDVSIEDAKKWNLLKEALDCGAIGSKILVTTRKMEVANLMRAETRLIPTEPLDGKACWSMFSELAFFGGDRCEQLEDIGKKIVIKCEGVPLKIKILGSFLRFKRGRKQWEGVLLSKLWDYEDDKIKSFVPFLLSYDDLSPVEKRCLLYCSIFPKDYKIEKRDVIEMWMSQGYYYFDGYNSLDVEKLCQGCFETLATRSFFHGFTKDYNGNNRKMQNE